MIKSRHTNFLVFLLLHIDPQSTQNDPTLGLQAQFVFKYVCCCNWDQLGNCISGV